MEDKHFTNYSNIFLNMKVMEDTVCDYGIPEHCLIYVFSGRVDFNEPNHAVTIKAGECAFIRKGHRIKMTKYSDEDTHIYQSALLRFPRKFLLEYYRHHGEEKFPGIARRSKKSTLRIPSRPDVTSLFESIFPYFNSSVVPDEEWLGMKLKEGLYVVLKSDTDVYASLFDFAEPWKIDMLGFMEENYMYDLSIEELAAYTGRSLTGFKNDFRKVSELTPQKWIIKRRLEAAHELIVNQHCKVNEAMMNVGFKNLSHFSRIYKETYGIAPSFNIR